MSEERLVTSVLDDRAERRANQHLLILGFCHADPLSAWRGLVAPALDALGEVRGAYGVGFASPFLRTIPGTDAYVDEL
jgi:hypothetical protein